MTSRYFAQASCHFSLALSRSSLCSDGMFFFVFRYSSIFSSFCLLRSSRIFLCSIRSNLEIACVDNFVKRNVHDAFQNRWAVLGSNQRPPRCRRDALNQL